MKEGSNEIGKGGKERNGRNDGWMKGEKGEGGGRKRRKEIRKKKMSQEVRCMDGREDGVKSRRGD
jgi:hypothetical protein